MYVVRHRRGLGAFNVSNPAACGFTDLGVLKGICWCTSVGQTICDAVSGPGSYAAAIAAQSPDVAYPPPLVPAPPTGPSTVQEETQPGAFTPSQAISQASDITKQQNLDFFKQISGNLDQLGGGSGTSATGLSTTAKIAIGLAAGVGILMLTGLSGGRRRR